MKVKIEFEVNLPDNIELTDDEIEEFLRYHFRDNGIMSGRNPLVNEVEPEPIFGTFYWGYD